MLAYLAVVLPQFLSSLASPKRTLVVGEVVAATPVASTARSILLALLVIFAVRLGYRHLNSVLPPLAPLVVAMLPWLYMLLRDAHTIDRLNSGIVIYPLVAVCLWLIQPRLNDVTVCGWTTAHSGRQHGDGRGTTFSWPLHNGGR